jgi:hypothetical protein
MKPLTLLLLLVVGCGNVVAVAEDASNLGATLDVRSDDTLWSNGDAAVTLVPNEAGTLAETQPASDVAPSIPPCGTQSVDSYHRKCVDGCVIGCVGEGKLWPSVLGIPICTAPGEPVYGGQLACVETCSACPPEQSLSGNPG